MASWSHQHSNLGDAILTTTYNHDYIARGYGMAIEEVFGINSASTLYLFIDYTTYTDFSTSNTDLIRLGRDGTIFILPPLMSTTAGPVMVSVYRDGNYSGGTPVLYNNRNTLCNIEPQITITSGATGTDKGKLVLEYLVGADSTNQNKGGGSSNPNIPFIRDNTGKAIVEIDNQSGFDILFSYNQIFYEA